tara:strand:- start:1502 stop:1633 length:132 start_codon:yes stop_codon:yes gene_type:complete
MTKEYNPEPEMGRTDPIPDARLHRMAANMRDKVLVDKFLAENP